MAIPIPPIEEQLSIVEYINQKVTKIDDCIITKTKQKECMLQHKKSLIYEYVTGKKRVKEAM